MASSKNKGLKLNSSQKEVLVGSLLGDCWLEKQDGPRANARIGQQQKDKEYFDQWFDTFKDWITEKPKQVLKSYKNGPKTLQWTSKTIRHSEFTEYQKYFYSSNKKKVVPKVDWLKQEFSDKSLATLFDPHKVGSPEDGSRHGLEASTSFDIHTQGFGFEGSARLALVLFEKFGLYAYPTRDIRIKDNATLVFWNVFISSDSCEKLQLLVKPLLPKSMQDSKLHPKCKPTPVNPNAANKQPIFYAMFKENQDLRNNVEYKISDNELQAYIEAIYKVD